MVSIASTEALDPQTILFVHASDEMYGADKILLQLVEGLPAAQFRPIVVLPNDVPYQGQLSSALRARGVETIQYRLAILRRRYFTPFGMLQYFWRLFLSTLFLLRLIRQESVSLVHSNTSAVIPGALAAKILGIRHVWHIHEIITRPIFLWKMTSWLLSRLSDRVVAVSGPTRDHICEGDRRNLRKAVVIHNGIDPRPFDQAQADRSRIRSEWGIAPDQPLVGMIGRVSHWKGQDYFLQVAARVMKAQPRARFVLVGGVLPGQQHLMDNLRQTITALGLGEAVTLSDFRSDVPSVLHAYDVFVLPSTLPDPFPTVILEAMAAGKPVVANAHGGSIEMIEEGVTGCLVQPYAPDQMASAITLLCADSERRLVMGACARVRIERLFSLDRFLTNWTQLYRDLLDAG